MRTRIGIGIMNRTWLRCTAAAFFTVALGAGVFSGEQDFDPDSGYRIARYRSPVPSSVPGGKTVAAADIAELLKSQNAILVDVMPSDGAGPDPSTGTWRITTPRTDIPGSVWLPDVGKGKISADLDTYFRDNLTRLTRGNKSRAIIVYCQSDCWMSWNAVKRASAYGYTALYWFPEGSDGWRDWDGSFVNATPVPMINAGFWGDKR